MIAPMLAEGATQVVQAQVPFDHIGLGTVIQAIMFLLACAGFYFNFRKHRNETERTAREAEDRIVNALKADIADKHRLQADNVAELERRVDKVENKAEAFMPETKIVGLVSSQVDEVRHKHGNELSKLYARMERLETSRTADVERIVKLETNIANIEKGQERIEKAVEKNHQEVLSAMKVWADQFATSIREVREVKAK